MVFFCISRRDVGAEGFVIDIPVSVPFSIAAIDPDAEAELFGLDAAVVSGRYLEPNDGLRERAMEINWYAGGVMPVSPALLAGNTPVTDLEISARILELGSDTISEVLAVNPRNATPVEDVSWGQFPSTEAIFEAVEAGVILIPRRTDQMDIVAAADFVHDFGVQELSLADGFERFAAQFASKLTVETTDAEWATVTDMLGLAQMYRNSREIWSCILIRPGQVSFTSTALAVEDPEIAGTIVENLEPAIAIAEEVDLTAEPVVLLGTPRYRISQQPQMCPGVVESWEAGPGYALGWWFPVLGTTSATSYRNSNVLNVVGNSGPGVPGSAGLFGNFGFDVVGLFDPNLVAQGGAEFARVPLETYRTEPLLVADVATKQVLGSDVFLPNLNPLDYFTLPPAILIPIDSVGVLDNRFLPREGFLAVDRGAPISAIRVRVDGITGLDDASLERINLVSQQIALETGLAVDIVIGSSLVDQPVTLAQPGDLPDLHLIERWSQVGAVTVIRDAVDQKSVLLFTLILASGILTIAAVASAAAAAQRSDLGTLAAVGYRPRRLWGFLLAQQAGLGFGAGAIGALISWPVAALMGVHISPERSLLAIPIATALTALAALPSAISAARTYPIKLLKPAVRAPRRAFPVQSAGRMGVASMLRRPLRLLRASLAIAIAVAAVTVSVVITTTFQGLVTGTLLGNSVLLQVRTADIVAGIILTILGLVCLTMTMRFAHLEDASDWAVLAAVGWSPRLITRAVLMQGALAGLLGAILGLVIALVLTATLIGTNPLLVIGPALAVALATVLLTTVTSLIPAAALQRAPLAHTLTRE